MRRILLGIPGLLSLLRCLRLYAGELKRFLCYGIAALKLGQLFAALFLLLASPVLAGIALRGVAARQKRYLSDFQYTLH
jgi:hypothetical protein